MPEKKGLNLEVLKEIIRIMKDEDVGEVCIEQDGMKVKVKRMLQQPAVATQGAAFLTSREEAKLISEAGDDSGGLLFVTAPMVGTFYRAPSQDAKPYVNVGDEIETGQVICIIEAMKLMNEITSDVDGEVVEILVEDGQSVEYDQPMLRVRPK